MLGSFVRMASGLLLCGVCFGCGRRAATPPGDASAQSASASRSQATSAEDSSACSPQTLGLGAAKHLVNWQPPAGCQGPSGGSPTPVVIRSEADFALSFHCVPEAPSGVNFANDDLVISTRMLSPAGAGSSVFDDGQTTTIVSLFRTPCEGGPMPMPMGYTLGFLLPAHSTRVFAEKTCTLEAHCN